MKKSQKVNNLILVILAIIDLAFGITSLFLSQIEWQICALISSTLTLIQIIRICVLYKEERKGEIFTLVVGIFDIITGVLSVALAIYAFKAICTLLSGLKAFKASKVAIQSSKALQLSKPITSKIMRKLLPIFSSFIIKKLRGKTQMENKKDTFVSYLKNNPKTIIGIIGSVVASLVCGGTTSYGMVLGNVAIPLWAKIIIGAVVFLVFAALTILGTISSGWENNAKVLTRSIAVQMGYENAVNVLEQAKAQYDAEQERKAEQEKAKEEQEKAVYRAKYIALVGTGYTGSLDDFIKEQKEEEKQAKLEAEKQEKEREEELLKAKWMEEIRLGATDLGFDKWKKTQN